MMHINYNFCKYEYNGVDLKMNTVYGKEGTGSLYFFLRTTHVFNTSKCSQHS